MNNNQIFTGMHYDEVDARKQLVWLSALGHFVEPARNPGAAAVQRVRTRNPWKKGKKNFSETVTFKCMDDMYIYLLNNLYTSSYTAKEARYYR